LPLAFWSAALLRRFLTGRPFMRWRIDHPRLDRSMYLGIERQFRGTAQRRMM
jgi:hypothetical protein